MNKRRIKRRVNKVNNYSLGGKIASVGSGVTGIADAITKNSSIADTTALENEINTNNNKVITASDNDALMNEWSTFNPIDNVTKSDIRGGNTGQRLVDTAGGIISGATSGAKLGGPIGAIVGGGVGLLGSVGSWITGGVKATKKANELNQQIDAANNKMLVGLNNKAASIDNANDLNLASNFFEFGGNLYTNIPNEITHGGVFTNDVVKINNGGTHEENPLQGVPMGIDSEGIPNLVEEGEIKYNDYIFSNKLKVDSKSLEILKLPRTLTNKTFADAADIISKESSERPNDPISKKGLEDGMNKLQISQELMKSKSKDKSKNNTQANMFDSGGDIDTKVAWLNKDYIDSITPDYLQNKTPLQLDVIKPESPIKQTTIPLREGSESDLSLSDLRYAPIVSSGITALNNLFSKPDYSNANAISESANSIRDVSYTPLGDYMTYNPLDRDFYTNKLNAQSSATRRSIVNQSGGNRATAIAGLLAADNNSQNAMGNLFRQAEEFNLGQKERVSAFNRGTNQANSQMSLQAQSTNQNADRTRASIRNQASSMRENIANTFGAVRSANIDNFVNNLGALGYEESNKDFRDMLIKSGVFGTMNEAALDAIGKSRSKNFKNGGKLKNKRKGLTY